MRRWVLAILGLAIAIALAVAFLGLAIDTGSDETGSDSALSTPAATPSPSPAATPTEEAHEPTFAPDGRTGIGELDRIIDDFVRMTAAELAEAYGNTPVEQQTFEGTEVLSATAWTERLDKSQVSLYSVLRVQRDGGFPVRDYLINLAVSETADETLWQVGVRAGGITDIYVLDSEPYAWDVIYNYDNYLVLPPQDELPKPPPYHQLSVRSGNQAVDDLVALVSAGDLDALLASSDPEAPVSRYCGADTQAATLGQSRTSLVPLIEEVVGLHAVINLPEGHSVTADHMLLFVLRKAPYRWEVTSVLEDDGRIVALLSCESADPGALYPPRSYPAPPLPDIENLDDARRSGVAIVDVFLDALQADDTDALAALIDYEQQGCIVEPLGIGSPPFCRADEPEGTQLDVLLSMQCEGSYARSDEIEPLLENLIEGDWALYAVADLGEVTPRIEFLRGTLIAVVVAEDNVGPDPFLNARALHFSQDGLTAVRHGCGQSDPNQLIWNGGVPDFLLPPP